MRCKQGDLAVIVKSWAGNEGKIVKCVRSFNGSLLNPDGSFLEGVIWEVDENLKTWDGTFGKNAPDVYLRPIRPSEGQDETLSWKDVPHKEFA